MFFRSSGLYIGALASLLRRDTLLAMSTVLHSRQSIKFQFNKVRATELFSIFLEAT